MFGFRTMHIRARDGVPAVTCKGECLNVFVVEHAACELHFIFTFLIVMCKTYIYA